MAPPEQLAVVVAGAIGLCTLAFGSVLLGRPDPTVAGDAKVTAVRTRRRPVIVGAVATITGAAVLLWPLVAVASVDAPDAWETLATTSVALWVIGMTLLAMAAALIAVVAWRDDSPERSSTDQRMLELSHLLTWSLTATVAALATVATTVVGVQVGILGPWVVAAAVVKCVTAGVEIAGTANRTGWNYGGWAAGTSGYATVAWFALLLVDIARF